jgi:hypothetical protein
MANGIEVTNTVNSDTGESVIVSRHPGGHVYLYGLDDTDTSIVSLPRAQARRVALALLGYNEEDADAYGVTIPPADMPDAATYGDTHDTFLFGTGRDALILSEPEYMADAPAITDTDAPPITDEDDSDLWFESAPSGGIVEVTDTGAPDDEYADDTIERVERAAYERGYDDGEEFANQRAVDEGITRDGLIAADHLGFERGYDAAVDDYRHGLWADEVEDDAAAWKSR